MDIAILKRRFSVEDAHSHDRFDRATRMLNDAVLALRRMTEDLHPTLLDNVGLFAPLRWQVQHMCHRSTLCMFLNLSGHEVQIAYSGSDALAAAKQVKPDVSVIDIGLPDFSGYEAAKGIQLSPGVHTSC